MISNYETPMWAENGWITDLVPFMDATAGWPRRSCWTSVNIAPTGCGILLDSPSGRSPS